MRRAPCCATEYNDPISMGWDVPIIKIAIADTEGGRQKNIIYKMAQFSEIAASAPFLRHLSSDLYCCIFVTLI